MSLLSSFLRNQLLKGLEDEFVSHVPEIQKKIVEEVGAFAQECADWVNGKLGNQVDAPSEQE